MTVNAVKVQWEQKPNARATAENLDMTANWTPTGQAYLGRVTKAHILAAVREAVEQIAGLKKPKMAQAAEPEADAYLQAAEPIPRLAVALIFAAPAAIAC